MDIAKVIVLQYQMGSELDLTVSNALERVG